MGAEGVRRRCDAVCTASTISQAKGQGFKSTETKHHVYGFLWKVDSFYRLFSYDILLLFSPYFYSKYNISQFNLYLARLVAVTYNKENNETISTIERKGT